MAIIYTQTGSEKALILGTREALVYPFTAPDWLDLRVGFYLSLTTAGASDTHTGLAETLTTTGAPEDRFWLGIKTNDSGFPHRYPSVFAGFTNDTPTAGNTPSILASSDLGVGTFNTDYWRISSPARTDGIFDNSSTVTDKDITEAEASNEVRAGIAPVPAPGSYIHFPQNVTNAGGYCVLVMLRFTRRALRAGESTTNPIRAITMSQKLDRYSTDISYSSVPSTALIRTALQNPPALTQSNVETTVQMQPDALYAYWPFMNSRLRIHALAIEKIA